MVCIACLLCLLSRQVIHSLKIRRLLSVPHIDLSCKSTPPHHQHILPTQKDCLNWALTAASSPHFVIKGLRISGPPGKTTEQ